LTWCHLYRNYQSAFRQSAGSAIAALARTAMIAKATGKHGEGFFIPHANETNTSFIKFVILLCVGKIFQGKALD